MANVKCPSCGGDIRYIIAAPSLRAGNNGIMAVETREEELLTEKGRLVRGFKRHKCRKIPGHDLFNIADGLKCLAPKAPDHDEIIGRILGLIDEAPEGRGITGPHTEDIRKI